MFELKIAAITRISPSIFTSLKRCPYKEILAKSLNNKPTLPFPASVYLGNVVHRCLELISKREIRTLEDFEIKWRELVTQMEVELKANGLLGYIPLKQNAPRYALLKMQAKRKLKNTFALPGKAKKYSVYTEKKLGSKDGLLDGKLDLLIENENYVKIVDYKSGEVYDSESGEIKVQYQDQLKLYAYLYFDNFKRFPTDIVVADLMGGEHILNVSKNDCFETFEEAISLLNEINDKIYRNQINLLANPSEENCGSCLYRPNCRYYWASKYTNREKLVDLKGPLRQIQQFRNGNCNIQIENDGLLFTITNVNGFYYDLLQDKAAQYLGLYNLMPGVSENFFKFIKTSQIVMNQLTFK